MCISTKVRDMDWGYSSIPDRLHLFGKAENSKSTAVRASRGVKSPICQEWVGGSKARNAISCCILKGPRGCLPNTCHFGIRIILSWRQVRKSRHRMSSLPFPIYLKAEHKFPWCKCPYPHFLYQEKVNNHVTRHDMALERAYKKCSN